MGKRAHVGFESGRTGGCRQRIARAAAAPPPPPKKHSALVTFLLEEWSWGFISTPKMQLILAKAKEDMEAHLAGQLRFEEISQLADIGAGGKHACNAVRDLERRIAHPALDAALYSYTAKVKSQVSKLVTTSQDLHVLLPHESFAIMHQHHKEEFRKNHWL